MMENRAETGTPLQMPDVARQFIQARNSLLSFGDTPTLEEQRQRLHREMRCISISEDSCSAYYTPPAQEGDERSDAERAQSLTPEQLNDYVAQMEQLLVAAPQGWEL